MTIQEYNQRLEGVIEDIQKGAHADILVRLANDAIAKIRDRVQERGLNPDGGRYREYSDSYKEVRREAGRQTSYVDFTFTGRMMGNIALTMDRGQLFEGIAVIKPQSQEEMNKLSKNEKMRGKILKLSEDEIKEIKEDYKEGIYQIWVNNGLGL